MHFVIEKCFTPLVVGFVMLLAVRLRLLAVPPSFWVVRSLSSLKDVQSSFVPPEPSLKRNVRVHTTWEEWEALSGLDSAALCVGVSETCAATQEHQTCEQRIQLATTHQRSDGLVCHSRSALGGCRSTTTLTSHCHLSPFSIFSHSMSHLLYRFPMNANSTVICPCVLSQKTSMRNLFGRMKCKGPLPHLFTKWRCLSCTSMVTQLLSGEADGDEVQFLTVGGETEDDPFLPTFVNVGEFWLKGARGPQRMCWWPQTRPGSSPRFEKSRGAFFRAKTR